MSVNIDNIAFEYITTYCDGYQLNDSNPGMVSVYYKLTKRNDVLSGVLTISFDEYKELTYNGLIDKVKEYVT
ncbi:hypothetical protein P4U07_28585 [Bacillus mycoides]|uniref:hypothetical protein n=1 Tax=Bacillus mycoides TaxID=1405 RepID=UPI002E21B0D9|nr:hypothetical protein [Bacillus mycoides]